MIWHWYSARPTELFIDCDRYKESINHIRARLQGALECEKIFIQNVHSYPSGTKNHYHIIIEMVHPIPAIERFAWEIIFHSDIYRGCCNIMRTARSINEPDILISQMPYHRLADFTCECPEKHSRKIMETCPAAIALRGDNRTAAFFGKPSKNPCIYL